MTQAATVRMVAEEEASGKVAEIYADIKATKGIPAVPNFWRVLASHPDNLEMIWTRLKALIHPEASGRESPLDPKHARDYCPGCFGNQWLRVLYQLPHRGPCASWAVTPKRWAK